MSESTALEPEPQPLPNGSPSWLSVTTLAIGSLWKDSQDSLSQSHSQIICFCLAYLPLKPLHSTVQSSLKNGPTPATFLCIFGLFKTNNTIFTTNQCEKCHVGAGIRTHNLSNMSRLPKPLDQGPILQNWFCRNTDYSYILMHYLKG